MVDLKANTEKVKALAALGLDTETEIARIAKKELFFEGRASNNNPVDFWETPKKISKAMPDIFSFAKGNPGTDDKTYGYIRIYSFDVYNSDNFLKEFARIVTGELTWDKEKDKPQSIDGLIIDVRGNGGGLIHAAEDLLQLIATWKGKGEIVRTTFDFINTPLTLELCEKSSSLKRWRRTFAKRLEAGNTHSLAYPLLGDEPPPKFDNTGNRIYDGPIVLI
ncbi:MAG: hypothetical protein GY940_43530, partial [bacterium]|nr:hypothetical protein [bacterium]